MKDEKIKNKNLLYASYVAYKDKLNDLSIETFRACIKNNPSNEIVKGIANYYIGKNLFLQAKYSDALTHFNMAQNYNYDRYNSIKFEVTINTAITYHRLNMKDKFTELIQKVIQTAPKGKYKKIAERILSNIK